LHRLLTIVIVRGMSTLRSAEGRDFTLALLLIALFSLTPLIIHFNHFSALFWFGDEIDLIRQIDSGGFWPWTLGTFAENYVPLFKTLWGGALYLFNGSYFAMILLLWLTHFLNTFLLGRIMISAGAGLFSSCLAMITFGVSFTTVESLGWSVQWSAILAMTFFLLGIKLCLTIAKGEKYSITQAATYLFLSLASAVCFSRGVLACAILCFAPLVLLPKTFSLRQRLFLSFLPALPAIFVTLIIFQNSTGNHQQIISFDKSRLFQMSEFMFACLSLNPIAKLSGAIYSSYNAMVFFGFLKTALICVTVLYVSRGSRSLSAVLIVLLAFDLGNAFLLGVGRYHTGLQAAMSSRYQYESLIVFAPFLGIFIDHLFTRVVSPPYFKIGAIILAASWLMYLVYNWKSEIIEWSTWRGTDGRKTFFKSGKHRDEVYMPEKPIATVLSREGKPQWIGIPPFITGNEAMVVVKKYNLH
jgi:hypothetical protein